MLDQIQHREETARCAEAVCEAEYSWWVSWKSVDRKTLSWRKLWGMETSCIQFIMGATCDVLPLRNLSQWVVWHSHYPMTNTTSQWAAYI